jgi:hypothetical protein
MSDVISFHSYDKPEEFEKRIVWLQPYHRPILCTEYMARGNGSTFQGSLPIAKKYHVAAINWGLVAGKTQTYLPWDSWQHPYTDREPAVWFHEIFRNDGTPYNKAEVNFILEIIANKPDVVSRVVEFAALGLLTSRLDGRTLSEVFRKACSNLWA